MRMKSFATLAVLASALAACGGEEPPPPEPPPPPPAAPPPPPPPTAEAPPAPPPKPSLADLIPVTVKNVTDAFNAHDAQKFAANYTADAVVTEYGAPAEEHGRDDIVKGIQMLFDFSSDVKGGAAHLWSKGNVLIVDWVTAGIATGDFMGAKATKKPFGNHRLIVAQLKDDVKALSGLFAPDGDVTFQFMGGKVVKAGKELDKFHTDFLRAIPKAQFAIVNAWGIDGFAIVERTISGTQKGRLGPLPASNKDLTLHVSDVLLPTDDGKISHAWAFGNMAEAAPPPPMPKAAGAAGSSPK